MKKLLTIILSLAAILSLTACGDKKTEGKPEIEDAPVVVADDIYLNDTGTEGFKNIDCVANAMFKVDAEEYEKSVNFDEYFNALLNCAVAVSNGEGSTGYSDILSSPWKLESSDSFMTLNPITGATFFFGGLTVSGDDIESLAKIDIEVLSVEEIEDTLMALIGFASIVDEDEMIVEVGDINKEDDKIIFDVTFSVDVSWCSASYCMFPPKPEPKFATVHGYGVILKDDTHFFVGMFTSDSKDTSKMLLCAKSARIDTSNKGIVDEDSETLADSFFDVDVESDKVD